MLRTLAAVTPPDTAVAIITQRKPNLGKGFEDLRRSAACGKLFSGASQSGNPFTARVFSLSLVFANACGTGRHFWRSGPP
jgi:hypothetical protein